MRFHLLLALVVGLGCRPDGAEPSDPADPLPTDTHTVDTATEDGSDVEEEPAPYIVPDELDAEVDVDLAAAEAALQDALSTALGVTASPVLASYAAATSGQDDDCPYYYTTADGTYWLDTCTADDGTTFEGYAFAYDEVLTDPYGDGANVAYTSLFGAATVADPDGTLLELGGSAYIAHSYGAGYQTWTSLVQGTFRWDGAEAANTWMASDVDPDFTLYAYAIDGMEGSLVYVDGGLGNLDGGWAVAFDENQIISASLGVSCGTELSGVVGVRTPQGVWVDVIFDGESAVGCDGCGKAWVQGERAGEICVDATVLRDWEVSPW